MTAFTKIGAILERVVDEMDEAEGKYGPFTSTHEAYGVLVEEVAELFDCVRSNDKHGLRAEAVQVAAVALRIAKQTEWPRG